MVPALFEPAYAGGRTAAEHWDLTEQIFKDIVVVTGQAIRERHLERQGFQFTLKHLKPEKIFGTKPVWRHKTKVQVSDVHRTVSRNAIERMFCRIKDFRRVATRYDKRADNFLSAVLIAAAVTWWMPIESGA